METAITQTDSLTQIQTGLIAFEERKAKIIELAESATDLTLDDWKDSKTLKVISAKRKELKAERVAITKEGKSMRDLIAPVTKMILEKEKELVSILEPEEERLEGYEKWAAEEAEKERQAEIERENARIQKRIDELAEYGYQIDYADIKAMSDETFAKYLDAAKTQFEKEQAEKAEQERLRIEQEERERKEREAEQERLRKEREELERLRLEQEQREAELRKQQEAIEAERIRIEQEKQAAERAKKEEEMRKRREEEIQRAREEAAEQARIKAIEDAKEAERIRVEQEEKARIAAEKKAARQPDKVKIEAYINAIIAVPVPEMKTEEGMSVLASILELRGKLEDYAKWKANEL
jgi:hypothetical protein